MKRWEASQSGEARGGRGMRSGVLLGMLVSHYSTAELVKWRDNSHLRPSAAAFTHKDGHAARLMPLCRLLPLCSHMFACCRVCVCVGLRACDRGGKRIQIFCYCAVDCSGIHIYSLFFYSLHFNTNTSAFRTLHFQNRLVTLP